MRPLLFVSGIAALATIATVSLVGPLSHLRIKLVATDSAFIETGCYLGARYVETLDRKRTAISFVLYGGKMLRFQQQGLRWLYVPIESNPNSRNLVMVAPEAMRDYWEYLTSKK